jgi:hypothetical protein
MIRCARGGGGVVLASRFAPSSREHFFPVPHCSSHLCSSPTPARPPSIRHLWRVSVRFLAAPASPRPPLPIPMLIPSFPLPCRASRRSSPAGAASDRHAARLPHSPPVHASGELRLTPDHTLRLLAGPRWLPWPISPLGRPRRAGCARACAFWPRLAASKARGLPLTRAWIPDPP